MKAAVFTMAYNEAMFLPMWIAHYAKELGRENLFVVDAGSTDGSTTGLDVNCIRVPRATLDEERRTAFVHHFHASLLSYYDVVIFTDTDEFFVADPAFYPDLCTFLKDRPEERLAGIGANVTHVIDADLPLRADEPVLMQRPYVQFDSLYCKPNIGRKPIAWTPGFHSCEGGYTMSTVLYMFHLKAVDHDLFFQEFAIKKKAGLSPEAAAKGHGVQMAMSREELMAIYFPNNAGNLQRSMTEDFQFRADLAAFAQQGFRGIWSSKGAVAKVPARFQHCLPALSGQPALVRGAA